MATCTNEDCVSWQGANRDLWVGIRANDLTKVKHLLHDHGAVLEDADWIYEGIYQSDAMGLVLLQHPNHNTVIMGA